MRARCGLLKSDLMADLSQARESWLDGARLLILPYYYISI